MHGWQPGIGARLRAALAVVAPPEQRGGHQEEGEERGDGGGVREVLKGCEQSDQGCTACSHSVSDLQKMTTHSSFALCEHATSLTHAVASTL